MVKSRYLIFLVLIQGCATPYQEQSNGYGVRGGFEELELSPGKYYLSFQGNNFTKRTTALQYWHQRAGELCTGGYEVMQTAIKDNPHMVTEGGVVIKDTLIEGQIECQN